jgi:prepilin-type processing-associated H-X9-DG protein
MVLIYANNNKGFLILNTIDQDAVPAGFLNCLVKSKKSLYKYDENLSFKENLSPIAYCPSGPEPKADLGEDANNQYYGVVDYDHHKRKPIKIKRIVISNSKSIFAADLHSAKAGVDSKTMMLGDSILVDNKKQISTIDAGGYSGEDGSASVRHSKRANGWFIDGHVQSLTVDELKEIKILKIADDEGEVYLQ